jgi:hypothetical protein
MVAALQSLLFANTAEDQCAALVQLYRHTVYATAAQ